MTDSTATGQWTRKCVRLSVLQILERAADVSKSYVLHVLALHLETHILQKTKEKFPMTKCGPYCML